MRILVIGATGLIGKRVSSQLREIGHEVIAGSPSSGVDIITGKGLKDALVGTDVVIDLSNSTSPDEETAINFFRTAGQTLVAAEKDANVKHHLALSIVGIDKVQHIGYMQAKKQQEDNIKESGIPYTIIRSTQFHEHVTTIIAVQSNQSEIHVSTMDYQPIAADDVAALVTQIALEPPANGTIEIAGPERAPMNEVVERYLNIRNDRSKTVMPNENNQYMFYTFPKSGLVPDGVFRAGKIYFEDWAGQ